MFKLSGEPALNTGTVLDTLSLVGIIPVSKERFTIWARGVDIQHATALRTLVLKPSISKPRSSFTLKGQDYFFDIIGGYRIKIKAVFSKLSSIRFRFSWGRGNVRPNVISNWWEELLKVFANSESSAITWPLIFISWILADLDGILFIDSFRNFQV